MPASTSLNQECPPPEAAPGGPTREPTVSADQTAGRTLQSEIIWSWQEWESLAEEWAALDQRAGCEPSVTLEWTRALLGSHVTDTDEVFTVVLHNAVSVVAIVPAIIRRKRVIGGLDVAELQLLSGLHNTHSDMLRAYDGRELVAAFLKALIGLPCRWDVLRIERLLEGSEFSSQLSEVLAGSGLAHRTRRVKAVYSLELEASYKQFLDSRSAKFRNHLRRKTRQLDALGRVRILRAGRDLPLEEAYQHLLTIERRSWKHAAGTAISSVPRQEKFYRLLCEGAARRGRLHLMLMYLDDVPIAFNLGMTVGDRYTYLKTSFDEKLRRVSPSTVLRGQLIESLIAEHIREVDFQSDHQGWKAQWTNRRNWHHSVLVFNRTPRALACRAALTVRDWLTDRRRAEVSPDTEDDE